MGLLEAATDKKVAGTGRRLESNIAPSSAPSFTPCPSGYVDCVEGNEVGTGQSCFAACNNGTDCCAGAIGGYYNEYKPACEGTTACIEKNNSTNRNCVGFNACYKVGFNGGNQPKISGGSCSGDSACNKLAYNYDTDSTSFVGSIRDSCTGKFACAYLASNRGSNSTSFVGSISDSCTTEFA